VPGSGDVLLVSRRDYLRDEVERIVAASGGSLIVSDDAGEAAALWDEVGIVLLGSDIRELPPRRRPPAALLGMGDEDGSPWHLAAALGIERVALLPDAGPWLAEFLNRSRSPEPGGRVLGLIGGCGGAGATTAAIWLAQAAASNGVRTLLVDGDPWGGGLELALAAEEGPGLRWPDFSEANGSLDPLQLAEALPVAGGFSFLSWPGNRERHVPVDPSAAGAVMDAARRGYELVVVDIGRGRETMRMFAWDCDRLLIVSPAHLKAAVAAARLVHELPPVETALIIRGRTGAALDGQLIADSVGLRLEGAIPEVRSAAAAVELGRLLETGHRKAVRRFAASVLEVDEGELP
jgi:secretion/DNA translocation related CpaE-like protein